MLLVRFGCAILLSNTIAALIITWNSSSCLLIHFHYSYLCSATATVTAATAFATTVISAPIVTLGCRFMTKATPKVSLRLKIQNFQPKVLIEKFLQQTSTVLLQVGFIFCGKKSRDVEPQVVQIYTKLYHILQVACRTVRLDSSLPFIFANLFLGALRVNQLN